VPDPFLHVGIEVDVPDVADLEPQVGIDGFEGHQPYKLVLIGEKSDLVDVLGPAAATHKADLYLPTGEPSDTMLYGMARIGAEDGRPMRVLWFSDCDPSGWQMPISTARKLQAFRTLHFPELEFEVHRVALTPGQVVEYGLPSTPLKAKETRADRWQQSMGVEQTEIDALAALQPGLLQQMARDAVAPFYDATLERRVFEAKSRWLAEAQQIVDESVNADDLERIRVEAADKLGQLREQIDAINDALQVEVGTFELPVPIVPDPIYNGAVHGTPLLDSRWSFVEQCRALIESKAYRNGGAS
jgi:hypothetical protein